jgi:hypothetical protein
MSDSKKFGKLNLFKLEDASQHPRWKNLLQTHMFKLFHNTNMDKLQPADTLDPDYYKTSADFKDDFKEASKDADNNKIDPFRNPTALEFATTCFEHALDTGDGFHPWLYVLFDDVRSSLNDSIQDKTAGVALGDLVGLLSAVKLSIHHYEHLDPDDLFLAYAACNMSGEGSNELMTYLTRLTQYRRRLQAVDRTVTDSRAQRVLLKGLDQDIFESFINTAERHPIHTVVLTSSRKRSRQLPPSHAFLSGSAP